MKSLAVVPEKDIKFAENLRKDAQKYFGAMQKSWYSFAKVIYEIKNTESYSLLGKESFKEFCVDEYPTISWSTICKFLSIVENWGKALDSKIEKDESCQLPAYESCYRLVVAEDKLPREEVAKLKKQVLDNRLSYYSLVDRLKECTEKIREKIRDDVDKSTEAIEKELEDDIKRKRGKDDEDEGDGFMDDVDEDLDVDLEDEDDIDTAISAIRSRVKFVSDNLPVIQKKLTAKLLTDEAVELAKEMEQLVEIGNGFLNKMEELSSE